MRREGERGGPGVIGPEVVRQVFVRVRTRSEGRVRVVPRCDWARGGATGVCPLGRPGPGGLCARERICGAAVCRARRSVFASQGWRVPLGGDT